jgi:hypothetical protein
MGSTHDEHPEPMEGGGESRPVSASRCHDWDEGEMHAGALSRATAMATKVDFFTPLSVCSHDPPLVLSTNHPVALT